MKRHNAQASNTTLKDSTATTSKAQVGCAQPSHNKAGTKASPPSDSAQLLNGSGEWLTAARVLALAAWALAARVPPASAASSAQPCWSPPPSTP